MSSSIAQQEILALNALSCLGRPYLYGASPDEAPAKFDCSSFVQYLYKNIGVVLPRTAIEQAHMGEAVLPDQLQKGDLLFFRGVVGRYNREFPQGIGHVAVFVGNKSAVQATGGSKKVILTPIKELLDRDDLVVIKRML